MPVRVIPQRWRLVPYDQCESRSWPYIKVLLTVFSSGLSVLMENTGGKFVTHLYQETRPHHLTACILSAIHYSTLSFACVCNPYFAAVSFILPPFTYCVSPLNPAGDRGVSQRPKCTETLFCVRHSAGLRAQRWIKPPLQETFTQTSKI